MGESRQQTITDYLSVIRRYKWAILVTFLLVPTVAYTMSARKNEVFRAQAEVLLTSQDLGATITGIPTQSTSTDPWRYARTQARLAQSPAVTSGALERAGLEGVGGWGSNVTADPDTDILTFGVSHGDPEVALRLANAYAESFVQYKLEQDTASLARARREIQSRLEQLRKAGANGTDTYRELLGQAQDLRTLELLITPASIISKADSAGKIAPLPRRSAILGAMLGLLLGVAGAFLLNALDRRIRSADEIESELQIPLLAKLPTPRRGDPPTILELPPNEMTESVARLRTSFDFANTKAGMRLVMTTSAGAREGKSTTVANLAISLARAGRRVVLVDLDLHRPSLARLFHLPDNGVGITDVAVGSVDLSAVLRPVVVTPRRSRLSPLGAGTDGGTGVLEVITSGRRQVEPNVLVESPGLAQTLNGLRSRADVVLLDSAPLLATGEALGLSAKVDGLLLVSRLGTLTRPALRELARMLDRSPAPIVGWVATGAEIDEGYATYRPYSPSTALWTHFGTDDSESSPNLDLPQTRSASEASGRWTPKSKR